MPPGELAATPLVSRESGSGTRGFFEQALRAQAGLERVPPQAELSSTTAIKAAVAAGAGPAVLSSLAVAAELSAGTLRAVTITGLNLDRTLLAVWAPGRRLAGPARDLYAVARSARQPAARDDPVRQDVSSTPGKTGSATTGDRRTGRSACIQGRRSVDRQHINSRRSARTWYRRAGAGQSRSVIAATIPVAESNAVTPWSYSTAKVLPLGENRAA